MAWGSVLGGLKWKIREYEEREKVKEQQAET
jgi:hypothetical protein